MDAILEFDDIQGYVIRGYARLICSRFYFLKITDKQKTKKWIGTIWPSLTNAVHIHRKENLPEKGLNIAFTCSGLSALGLDDANIGAFSREFRQGMATEHRSRLLGDFDSSCPENWIWGGYKTDPVHLCLMVFVGDENIANEYYEEMRSQFEGAGLEEMTFIDGLTLPENKEHFGFRDGISQPIIKGSGRPGPKDDMVEPGEFIMGYKNNYGVFPDTPLINSDQGELNLLPTDAAGSGKKDIGRNGTYLVMRQLEQNVEAFWTFMNEQTKNPDGSTNVDESNKLAAKMMGRWPSGAPVTKFPDADPGQLSDDNDFGYAEHDQEGLKCPFGSHLRRSNPRDSFEDLGKKESILLSNRHRIIRRARLYGDRIEGNPTKFKPKGEVGLLFACFNVDISRQFEFVQYSWANSGKVKQLYNDPDPIIGTREILKSGEEQNFTIQEAPVNRTIKNLQRFITVRGGSYFFFPSISAIRYLSTL
jgi:Dyp-type peroxidase family